MNNSMKSSIRRLWFGIGLGALALLVALFLLPDASGKAEKQRKSAQDALVNLDRQLKELSEYEEMLNWINVGRQRIADLEEHMPKGNIGDLHLSIKKTLHQIAKSSGVRLPNVKYGFPNKDGSRNTGVETLDVEFKAVGVYQNLKTFMLALEGSGQPFGAASVKLDESPEGGQLIVVLRAFRQTSDTALAGPGGEAL
jgi:CRISPR/Cas system-associated protein endoribonuclease Cas2